MYKNTNCFHLAIPCGDLEIAKKFYSETLGCRLDNSAQEWADVDFWGNELTLHKTHTKLPKERHAVDMGSVSIPHFGAHLDKEVFEKIKTNLKTNNIKYFDEPYVRFKGREEEQETFFLEDPHGNVLELKTFSK